MRKTRTKDKRQMDKYRSFSHPVQDMRPYFMELIKPQTYLSLRQEE